MHEAVTPAKPAAAKPPGEDAGPLLRRVRDQRIAFMIVGTFNTVFGYSLFAGLQLTVGPVAGYIVVLLVTHVVSVLFAFVLYRTLVFRVQGHVFRDLARFELVYLSSLGVNLLLLPLLVEFCGLSVLFAQALIVLIVVTMSFFGHRHFSFRRRSEGRVS